MKYVKLILVFILISSHASFSEEFQYITVGPIFHWYFQSSTGKCFTYGCEFSYWKTTNGVPFSIDIGFESAKTLEASYIYSELQTGIPVVGISIGGTLEMSQNNYRMGFQSTIWGGAFLFGAFRYRRFSGISQYGPGAYVKIPIYSSDNNYGLRM